jgi:hypothetical protein
MDVCFHWLRCRNAQGQFCYYWRPDTQNLADYFTKHHPTSHHKSVCPTILTPVNNLMIFAYLGQTPEVPRTDLRAKHHS